MKLRRAGVADAPRVLEWRNDPQTRAMSLDDAIIAAEEHLPWFARGVADPDRLMLIGEVDGAPVGMVRFDRGPAGWQVSINVAPEARGRGLGRALLAGGLEALGAACPGEAALATVRADNRASVRLFEAAGFSRCGEGEGLVRYRRPAP